MYNVLIVVGLVMTVLATGCSEMDLTKELDYASMQEGVKPVEVIEVEVLREVVEVEVEVLREVLKEVVEEAMMEVVEEVVEVPIFDNEDNIIGTELLKKEVDTVVEEVLL
jgi:hypothetical protein